MPANSPARCANRLSSQVPPEAATFSEIAFTRPGTGKVAPEHRRLSRYSTMPLAEIMALPVGEIAAPTAHLYLWCPNALFPDALAVMKAWGFTYKSNIVWHKVRKALAHQLHPTRASVYDNAAKDSVR
jgi:MT-A70